MGRHADDDDGTVLLTVLTGDSDARTVRVGSWEELAQATEPAPTSIEQPSSTPSEIPEGPVSVAPMRPAAGFRDHGEIGRGGMGAIRHVIDNRLLRPMALKTLTEEVAASSDAGRRFVEEAQITGQLDHPNIVPVHTLGRSADGSLYFTMKLVRGKTLGEVLGELGRQRLEARNLEHLVQIIVKVCDAIAFAHSRGVVHRDLKPGNVMLGNYGQVYVMDWGLALLRTGPRLVSDEDKIIGTPGYMSPEQAWGKTDVDGRADVYGIGALLYRILTGKRPHAGAKPLEAVVHTREGRRLDPQAACPDEEMPPELCRITLRALEHDIEARYPSVRELQHDLEQFLRGGGWLATRDYEDGTVIIEEGDGASEAYIIVSGECEAFKTVNGERVSLRKMTHGDVFGETAILTSKPRSASVVALGPVRVKVVTSAALERELGRETYMGSFVRVLAERFRELDEKIDQVR